MVIVLGYRFTAFLTNQGGMADDIRYYVHKIFNLPLKKDDAYYEQKSVDVVV